MNVGIFVWSRDLDSRNFQGFSIWLDFDGLSADQEEIQIQALTLFVDSRYRNKSVDSSSFKNLISWTDEDRSSKQSSQTNERNTSNESIRTERPGGLDSRGDDEDLVPSTFLFLTTIILQLKHLKSSNGNSKTSETSPA